MVEHVLHHLETVGHFVVDRHLHEHASDELAETACHGWNSLESVIVIEYLEQDCEAEDQLENPNRQKLSCQVLHCMFELEFRFSHFFGLRVIWVRTIPLGLFVFILFVDFLALLVNTEVNVSFADAGGI